MSASVEWRRNAGAEAEILKLAKEAVEKITFQVEGQAKRNIQENGQIDTGFMLNSVYAATPRTSSYGRTQPSGSYVGRGGQEEGRRRAPEAGLKGADGLVAVGAEYALWQEMRRSFLFRALQQVQGRLGSR